MNQSPLLRGCLAATMPMTSVPALAWACAEQGPAFAAAAAAAALVTTALTGLMALLHAHAAPRLAPAGALGAATLPAVLLAALTAGACSSHLAIAFVVSVLVLLTCRRLMPGSPVAGSGPHAAHRSNQRLTAAVGGGFTAWIGSIAPGLQALRSRARRLPRRLQWI
jgi:hypothetical protein